MKTVRFKDLKRGNVIHVGGSHPAEEVCSDAELKEDNLWGEDNPYWEITVSPVFPKEGQDYYLHRAVFEGDTAVTLLDHQVNQFKKVEYAKANKRSV